MEKSQAAKCLKFCCLWSRRTTELFRRTPGCIWEHFDIVGSIILLIHLALNGGAEKLGGWWSGTWPVLGLSGQGICLNLPLLSSRANDTQRPCLPARSHAHPSRVAPSNVHQNLSEMGLLMPCLCHLQMAVNWTSTCQARFQYSALVTLS